MGAYNGFFRRHHRRITAIGESATSLSLNPSVISVGKSVWCHHVVVYIPDELYTPSATPSVYTDGFADGLIPSVYTDRFWDGIIFVGINYRRKDSVGNSVAFLRFSGSVIYFIAKYSNYTFTLNKSKSIKI
jgi:hypothetical protein